MVGAGFAGAAVAVSLNSVTVASAAVVRPIAVRGPGATAVRGRGLRCDAMERRSFRDRLPG